MNAPELLVSSVDIHRLLLIFAPSAKTPAFEAQQRQLTGLDQAVLSRNLSVGQILREGACHIAGKKLKRDEVDALRQHFGIDPDQFCIVILDEQGSELHRDDAPLKLDVILNAFAHYPDHD